jgi:autotransporter translocation and assembly factor TamB
MMGAALRYLKRALAALLILVLLLIAGIAIYLRTPGFNRMLQGKVRDYLAASYRGQISFENIDASVLGRIVIKDITIADRGHQVAHIPLVRIHYSLIPLLWSSLHASIGIFNPVFNLSREPDGTWNLLEAISSKTRSKSQSTLSIHLNPVDVRNGTIALRPNGIQGKRYQLTGVAVELSAAVIPAGTEVRIKHLFTRIDAPGFPQAELVAALTYDGIHQPAHVKVAHLALNTQASALSLTGSVTDFNRMNVDGRLTITKLAASDIAAIAPAIKLRSDLTGVVKLHGPKDALHSDLEVAAGNAHLSAHVLTNLSAGPDYEARLELAGLDARQLLGAGHPAGTLSAKVNAAGSGYALAAITGQAKINDRGANLSGIRLGDIVMAAEISNGNARIDGTVSNGPSRVKLKGNGQLSRQGHYHMTVAASRLDLSHMLASNTARPTDLNFTLNIDGSGYQPAQLKDTLQIRLNRSKIARLLIDRGSFDATIANQRVNITRATITASGTVLNAHGNTGLSTAAPIRIAYRLQSATLAPWLKLANLTGDGRLLGNGTVAGKIGELRAQGTLDGQSLRYGGSTIDRAHATYDLAGVGHGIPHGAVALALTDVSAPVKLRSLDADIHIGRGQPVPLTVRLEAADLQNRHDLLAAHVRYRPALVEGRLERVALAMPDGVWRMLAPTPFSKNARSFSIGNLRMRNGRRELALNGNVAMRGSQHLTLTARGLSLADFAALMPAQHPAGELFASLEIGGSAAAPTIVAELDVTRLRMSSERIGDLTMHARYADREAALKAVFSQDPAHRLTASGKVPAMVQWADGFSARIGGNMEMRVYSAGLRLGPLGALAPATVKNAAGLLSADLTLRGAVAHPAVQGNLRLNDGRAYVIPLGIEVTDVITVVSASSGEIRITELAARSGKGTLQGNAIVPVSNYAPTEINAHVNFHDWPAIATREYKADIDGGITASGTPEAPRVTGQIEIKHGLIRPDLAFLTATSDITPDPTIEVIEPGQKISPAPAKTEQSQKPALSFNKLAMDVLVKIPRDNWIRHQNASVELQGRVHILKNPGGPMRLVGAINTVHGWIIFQNRQFNLASGTITFTGGHPIDPSLAVTAQYVINTYTINVVVSGTASHPKLNLTSIPQLAQADILSLLLFGKTSSQLGQGQSAALQQQAANMAAGAAASTIGNAVVQSLGLQGMGMQVSSVGASGARVGLGHYIGENTYLSFSQQIGTPTTNGPNQGVSIQYYILNWLSIKSTSFSDGSREIDLALTKQY